MNGSKPKIFLPQILIAILIFVVSVVTTGYEFIPYLDFYKNRSAQISARVFLASNYEGPPQVDSTEKTTDEINRERRELIGQKLNSPGFDRANVIILEEPAPISAQFGTGQFEVLNYSAEKLQIRTTAEVPKLLFVGEPYFFGWKAKVDGQSTKIFRANYSFRAVPLTGGDHVVEFYWDNRPFYFGVFLNLVLLVALFSISAGSRRRHW